MGVWHGLVEESGRLTIAQRGDRLEFDPQGLMRVLRGGEALRFQLNGATHEAARISPGLLDLSSIPAAANAAAFMVGRRAIVVSGREGCVTFELQ